MPPNRIRKNSTMLGKLSLLRRYQLSISHASCGQWAHHVSATLFLIFNKHLHPSARMCKSYVRQWVLSPPSNSRALSSTLVKRKNPLPQQYASWPDGIARSIAHPSGSQSNPEKPIWRGGQSLAYKAHTTSHFVHGSQVRGLKPPWTSYSFARFISRHQLWSRWSKLSSSHDATLHNTGGEVEGHPLGAISILLRTCRVVCNPLWHWTGSSLQFQSMSIVDRFL